MSSQHKPRTRKKPMSEINVVPYIDVMLVLLVIFMITAPLLTTGVSVDLPQATAQPMDSDAQDEPLIVTVDVRGKYFLNVGEDPDKAIDDEKLVNLVAAVIRHKPTTSVMVRGDAHVEYEKVVRAMSLVQKAGVPSVGLITRTPEDILKKKKR